MSDSHTPSTGTPRSGEHAWVRHRLAPFWAGLLSDADTSRLERHLDECDDCRSAWDAQAAHPPLPSDADAHVPAALFADWDRQQRTLRGLERAAIRHHLERCEDCRSDLRVLGHEPVLEFVAALEPASLMPSTSRTSPPQKPEPMVLATTLERLRLRSLALGGWAAAATATAAVLLFVLLRPVAVETPPGVGGPTLSSGGLGLAPALDPAAALVLSPSVGGDHGPTATLDAAAARTVLALQLRGLDAAAGDSTSFRLHRGDQLVLEQRLLLTRSPESGPVVVLRGATAALGAGDYRLEVRWLGEGVRYAFRLALR